MDGVQVLAGLWALPLCTSGVPAIASPGESCALTTDRARRLLGVREFRASVGSWGFSVCPPRPTSLAGAVARGTLSPLAPVRPCGGLCGLCAGPGYAFPPGSLLRINHHAVHDTHLTRP